MAPAWVPLDSPQNPVLLCVAQTHVWVLPLLGGPAGPNPSPRPGTGSPQVAGRAGGVLVTPPSPPW